MLRDFRVLLDDILEASQKIRTYTASLSLADFQADEKTIDAVVRNLEIIWDVLTRRPRLVKFQRFCASQGDLDLKPEPWWPHRLP